MSAALIATLMQVLELIIEDTPEAVSLFNTVKEVFTQGTDPTPAQWQALVTALASSHAKVQAS
jgi:hypothetical protein